MCHWDTPVPSYFNGTPTRHRDPHVPPGHPCATGTPMCQWDPYVPPGPPHSSGTWHDIETPCTTGTPPNPPDPPPSARREPRGAPVPCSPHVGGSQRRCGAAGPPIPHPTPPWDGGGEVGRIPGPAEGWDPAPPPRRDAAGGVGCAQSGGVGGVRPPAEWHRDPFQPPPPTPHRLPPNQPNAAHPAPPSSLRPPPAAPQGRSGAGGPWGGFGGGAWGDPTRSA